jgi:hypothetical protein
LALSIGVDANYNADSSLDVSSCRDQSSSERFESASTKIKQATL